MSMNEREPTRRFVEDARRDVARKCASSTGIWRRSDPIEGGLLLVDQRGEALARKRLPTRARSSNDGNTIQRRGKCKQKHNRMQSAGRSKSPPKEKKRAYQFHLKGNQLRAQNVHMRIRRLVGASRRVTAPPVTSPPPPHRSRLGAPGGGEKKDKTPKRRGRSLIPKDARSGGKAPR